MFRQLYFLLFNRITDAIGKLDSGSAAQAKRILIRAQQDAETLYLLAEEDGEGARQSGGAAHTP